MNKYYKVINESKIIYVSTDNKHKRNIVLDNKELLPPSDGLIPISKEEFEDAELRLEEFFRNEPKLDPIENGISEYYKFITDNGTDYFKLSVTPIRLVNEGFYKGELIKLSSKGILRLQNKVIRNKELLNTPITKEEWSDAVDRYGKIMKLLNDECKSTS